MKLVNKKCMELKAFLISTIKIVTLKLKLYVISFCSKMLLKYFETSLLLKEILLSNNKLYITLIKFELIDKFLN